MNPCEKCCDPNEMDAYLSGNLATEQQIAFEQRLSTCESCRQKLEEQAADQEVWDKARLLLNPGQELPLTSTSDESSSDAKDRSAKLVLEALGPTDDPEMLGRLGEYEISGVVGVGGMGAVLRGFDKSLRRIVAIKVMVPHLAGNGPARARFQREARAAAAITHDNVIDIHSVAESNGLPYIVMPFARGPSLQSRIDRNGPLTPLEVVRIGKQIASGLAAAHEQGLVHRDIKPANILLNEGVERLWITDFGVAHAMDDASMTKTGVIAGTPQYMSPEQARGESVDHASDLFSLGSVLYTACTGRPPFRSEAAYGILRRITDTEPRPIREINPDIPPWLVDTIGRLMAKQVSERFQSAGAVAELFESYLVYLQNPAEERLPYTSTPEVSGKELETKTQESALHKTSGRNPSRGQRFSIAVACSLALVAAMGAAAWQATAPVDISGTWSGEEWSRVTFSSVKEASGWYNGTFSDGEGSEGAIDLKWSRLKRRYTGRWKSGEERMGSITLRGSEGQQLRGAISEDAESSIRKDQARLRDFTWKRGNGKPSKTPSGEIHVNTRTVFSPAKGRIVKVSHEAQTNKTVEKGQTIAVIEQILDPDELEARLEAARLAIVEAEAERVKSKGALEIAMNNLNLEDRRLKLLQDSESQLAEASAREVDAATSKLEATKVELASANSSLELAQKVLDTAESVLDVGIGSQEALLEARTKLEASKAKRAQVRSQVVESESTLESKKQLLQAKQMRSQIELEAAKASVANAEALVSTAESENQLSERKLANAQKSLTSLENRRNSESTLEIVAPIDGRILEFKAPEGSVVKQGDFLCCILPDAKENTQEQAGAEQLETALEPNIPLGRPKDSVSMHIMNSLPPLAGDACRRLATTLQTASSFAQRYREALRQLSQAKETSSKSEAATQALAQLEVRLDEVRVESTNIVESLKARLKEFESLHSIETKLTENLKQGVNEGQVSQFEYLPAQLSFYQTEQDLSLMKQLVAFYAGIGSLDAAEEREQVIAMLQGERAAVTAALETQRKICEALKYAFESGAVSLGENLESQKALAKLQRQRNDLEQLLKRYSKLSENDIKSAQ